MAPTPGCPACGVDMSRPYAVRVEYTTALASSLAPDGRILLATVSEVSDEASSAEPTAASCTHCGQAFLITPTDLEGTDWA